MKICYNALVQWSDCQCGKSTIPNSL